MSRGVDPSMSGSNGGCDMANEIKMVCHHDILIVGANRTCLKWAATEAKSYVTFDICHLRVKRIVMSVCSIS